MRSQLDAFTSVLDGKEIRLVQLLVGFVVSWWLFVPLHELLHVLGCIGTGGAVTRLELSPWYGGAVFARWFPWVTSGGEYAGRLSGFRPAGDLSYLATVLAPLVVLCPVGSLLARSAVRRRRAWLFGFGLGAALQPIASLTGDCYEAASIPLTRLAALAGVEWALRLRGDDVFKIASEAGAVHSPFAWVLFAGGCILGAVLAALIFRGSGGVAPRSARPERSAPRPAGRWTRRAVLRGVIGSALVAAGGWILKSIFLPRRLTPTEAETFRVLLDTLIPDGEFPGASRTGVADRLRAECEAKRQTQRALMEGLRLLDERARGRGAGEFRTLARPQREEILADWARAADGTLPRFLYRTLRDRAMQLHYAHPLAWKRVGLPHPPQPDGYLDYRQPPDV